MPICSYMVYPVENGYHRLIERLNTLPNCEVMPAENQEILILITDTNTEAEEAQVQRSLKEIKEIRLLALTFGSVEKARTDRI